MFISQTKALVGETDSRWRLEKGGGTRSGGFFFAGCVQGCQIFLDTIYQNEGKCTKLPQHYQMAIKYAK
jgi:hypothetical protein